MKKATYLALSLLVAGGAFLAGTWYQHSASTAPSTGAGARKILYYVDPMHPAYRSDRPGIAPDCGMQLEPVYADGANAPAEGGLAARPAGTVSIGVDRQQLLGVRVATVEHAP